MDNKLKKTVGRPKKISLSAEEICKIIAECRSANVAEINLEGLQIVFQAQRNEPTPILGKGQETFPEVDAPPDNEEARLMNEQALLDAEEAQILIDDPLTFEKLNTSADIERGRVFNQ